MVVCKQCLPSNGCQYRVLRSIKASGAAVTILWSLPRANESTARELGPKVPSYRPLDQVMNIQNSQIMPHILLNKT